MWALIIQYLFRVFLFDLLLELLLFLIFDVFNGAVFILLTDMFYLDVRPLPIPIFRISSSIAIALLEVAYIVIPRVDVVIVLGLHLSL